MSKMNKKTVGVIVAVAAAVILLLICVSNSYYTVDDKQQAVITTFGKVTDITDAGIHFKIPFIQNVQRISAATIL